MRHKVKSKESTVEIYLVDGWKSGATKVYPVQEYEIPAPLVLKLLSEAKFIGTYFSDQDGGQSYCIATQNISLSDPNYRVDDIPLDPNEYLSPQGYGKVAKRIREMEPGHDVKVVIF